MVFLIPVRLVCRARLCALLSRRLLLPLKAKWPFQISSFTNAARYDKESVTSSKNVTFSVVTT